MSGVARCSLFIFAVDVLDLKAFERRLTEVIGCLQPATMRWRSEYLSDVSTVLFIR